MSAGIISLRWMGIGAAVAALAAFLGMGLVATDADAKVSAGPKGAKFYDYPDAKLGSKHGRLLRMRTAPKQVRIKGARTTKLVLFTSEQPDGSIIETSGLVAVPKGRSKGTVTWGHGTSGLADKCAPSRLLKAGRDRDYVAYQNKTVALWVKKGYTVAMADYQGLGSPGIHPFLIGEAEGRSMLDIVIAARKGLGKRAVNSKVSGTGHSQGGHAVLWAAGEAEKGYLGKPFSYKGTVAYAPASNLHQLAQALQLAPAGSAGLAVLIGAGVATQMEGDLAPKLNSRITDPSDAGLSKDGKSLWELATSECSGAVGELANQAAPNGILTQDLFGPFDNDNAFNPGPGVTPDYTDPVLAEFLQILTDQNPDVKSSKPLVIAHGTADTTVPLLLTTLLRPQLAAAGTTVDYQEYAGADHGTVIEASKAYTLAKLKEWF